MNKFLFASISKVSKKYLLITIIILVLGLYFRITNLSNKIYWVDEVATSLRVAGFTKQELIQDVLNLGVIEIKSLQYYQKITLKKSFYDLIKALIKSPEHAPLYFIVARIWTEFFGSSIFSIRSLSVIFSILSLPSIYWLCRLLFKSSKPGWIAVLLLAISPLYVAYAQEARPYSLWLEIILLSQITLLIYLRSNSLLNWFYYTIILILSLYTSLLSILLIIAQSAYVIIINKLRAESQVIFQLIAVGIALIFFSPWLIIMAQNWQQFQDNTTWMKVHLNLGAMAVIWFYSIATIFIETPIYLNFDAMILTRIIIDINLFILVVFSLCFICRKTNKSVWLFVLLQILIPLIIMRGLDLTLGGQRSTAIRYMMPSYLLIHVTVAYLFSSKISTASKEFFQTKKQWIVLLFLILFIEISSCTFMLNKSPQYQKTRNLHNPEIAQIVNHNPLAILLTEPSNILDAISISYLLKPSIQFQLISNPSLLTLLPLTRTLYVLNPSLDLINQIRQKLGGVKIEQVYQPKLLTEGEIHLSLWQLKT